MVETSHSVSLESMSGPGTKSLATTIFRTTIYRLSTSGYETRASRKSISVQKLGCWWPWDFSPTGAVIWPRENWGPSYKGPGGFDKKLSLTGGDH